MTSTSFPSISSLLNTTNTKQRPHNRVPKRTFDAVSEASEEETQVSRYMSKKRAMRGLQVRCRSLENRIRELGLAKDDLELKAGDALREVKALKLGWNILSVGRTR